MTLDELRKAVRKAAEPSTPKPGDISLPQPLADEVVELGTLAKSDRFEFDEREFNGSTTTISTTLSRALDGGVHTVEKPSSASDSAVWCDREQGGNFGYDRRRKVRRVPAPTPQPKVDVCADNVELDENGGVIRMVDLAQPDPTRRPTVKEPRWQTRDPARIAALEAKLAEQVASGGQDGKSARRLLERADKIAREELARQHPLTDDDIVGRGRAAYPPQPYRQPGGIFNRRDYRPRPRRK